MILKGSQRAGAMQLARHLLNTRENDHIELHELRGFVSDSLSGAFKEIQAIARGTRCEQFLFSLSLNPPETENVSVEVFEKAIEAIESKIGLAGQPRALIFHEKKGRRHAHCVWSRIDARQMKAINLPHFKRKLNDIARDLYHEHGWKMPPGFIDHKQYDPLSYNQAEGQQAARTKQDPQALKSTFRQCWECSDSLSAFTAALREHGLILAKGDRRGFVAVDLQGEVYSIARWTGVKARDVRAKLGDNQNLPSVEVAQQQFTVLLNDELTDSVGQLDATYKEQIGKLEAEKQALKSDQRKARDELKAQQNNQIKSLIQTQRAKLPTGLKATWQKLSGRYQAQLDKNAESLRRQREAYRDEWQHLVQSQLQERHVLEQRWRRFLADHALANDQHQRDIGEELEKVPSQLTIDPAQPLIIPPDEEELAAAALIRQDPEEVLAYINDKKEFFTRNDIARNLAKFIDDPVEFRTALNIALASKELVKADTDSQYTTQNMTSVKAKLNSQISKMAGNANYGVSKRHINAAITKQNERLQNEVGANLSDEQETAIRHVLGAPQISSVVGLAGAGKSTMLEAARDAWECQGYQVIGAALAGKAADGLEQSSGINSRTLASLEYAIEGGNNPLTPNTVLVIDEAGMAGTRQMNRITTHVKEAGAKLVLIGDPEQLQPIQAGKPFKEIINTQPTARLTEIRRQKNQWQRDAVRQLAEGKIDEALQTFEEKSCVSHCTNSDTAITSLVNDYVQDIQRYGDKRSRLALAYLRKDVHAINQGIRTQLKQAGKLTDEHLVQTDHGPRAFAPGDRIVFTRNDRPLRLRNGMLGSIQYVDEKEISVLLDNGPIDIQIPLDYHAIDHGYSTTIHKSQGCTLKKTYILDTGDLDNHLQYVAYSRNREEIRSYFCTNSNRRLRKSTSRHRENLVIR